MRLSSLLLTAGFTAAASSESSSDCADGLQIIVGRGTGEDAGPGVLKIVADRISSEVKGSKVVAVDYPATSLSPNYFDSVKDGTKEVHDDIVNYAKKCPNSKIAYLGYSQGAQIASEAFCGTSNPLKLSDKSVIPIETVFNNVVAIALCGDPSHKVGFPYDKGTSQHDGVLARHDIGKCQNYVDRMVSYCDTGDKFCDSGQNDTVHGHYVQEYGNDIASFVVDKYNQAKDGNGGGSKTSSGGSATQTQTGSSSDPTSTNSAGGYFAAPGGLLLVSLLVAMFA